MHILHSLLPFSTQLNLLPIFTMILQFVASNVLSFFVVLASCVVLGYGNMCILLHIDFTQIQLTCSVLCVLSMETRFLFKSIRRADSLMYFLCTGTSFWPLCCLFYTSSVWVQLSLFPWFFRQAHCIRNFHFCLCCYFYSLQTILCHLCQA
jgi:hypothetical protein